MTNIEKYYNKFNEEHRLQTRHGLVEFSTSMHHIRQIIGERRNLKILDVGAGTGRYSVELCHSGHEVTAVELVKRNLEILRSKHEKIKTWQGNALDLSFLEENKFDIAICFGPMYHLHSQEERLKVMNEIKRVVKKDGIIFAAYILNEYALVQYCFGKGKTRELMENGALSEDFHCVSSPEELYSYLRLEDINEIQRKSGLERVKIFSQEGPADYMRVQLNSMDEETFGLFVKYVISISERPELLGAGTHIVDVLKNIK